MAPIVRLPHPTPWFLGPMPPNCSLIDSAVCLCMIARCPGVSLQRCVARPSNGWDLRVATAGVRVPSKKRDTLRSILGHFSACTLSLLAHYPSPRRVPPWTFSPLPAKYFPAPVSARYGKGKCPGRSKREGEKCPGEECPRRGNVPIHARSYYHHWPACCNLTPGYRVLTDRPTDTHLAM